MSEDEEIEKILQKANAVGMRKAVVDMALYFNNRFSEYTLLESYQMAYKSEVGLKLDFDE